MRATGHAQRAKDGPPARAFYQRDPRVVAPQLLNKLLVMSDGRSGRIVEVEAYCGSDDPASHAFRGQTARNASMFGPAGHLYVYFTYGMHWCSNVVCGDVHEGAAILLRALEPVSGLELMRGARAACKRDQDLCRGPARLCQALGIDRRLDGANLMTGAEGIALLDDGTLPPLHPVITPRIGISQATDKPWRWHVAGCRCISRG